MRLDRFAVGIPGLPAVAMSAEDHEALRAQNFDTRAIEGPVRDSVDIAELSGRFLHVWGPQCGFEEQRQGTILAGHDLRVGDFAAVLEGVDTAGMAYGPRGGQIVKQEPCQIE